MYYTKQTLIEINKRYDRTHGVTLQDVETANMILDVISKTRQDTPQVGDILEFTDKYGSYYRNAHIEAIQGEKFNICQEPYVPFVSIVNNSISTNTSGGPWCSVPKNVKFVGKRKKLFNKFGSCGACAGGAFYIECEVNVWEYNEDPTQKYTTKSHDKIYLSKNRNFGKTSTDRYKWFIDGTAFESDKQLSAYLQINRSKIRRCPHTETLILWNYKMEEITTKSKQEFDNTQGVYDYYKQNAAKYPCKRIYDDENKTVTTYYLPYEELEKNILPDDTTHYAEKYPNSKYNIQEILKNLK